MTCFIEFSCRSGFQFNISQLQQPKSYKICRGQHFGLYLDSGLVELGAPGQLLAAVDVRVMGLGEGGLQLLKLFLEMQKRLKHENDLRRQGLEL